jgi:hypothetical protein
LQQKKIKTRILTLLDSIDYVSIAQSGISRDRAE